MQLQKSQEQKINYDNACLDEIQKNYKLNQQLEVYENESLIAKTIAQAKENIWIEINTSMTELQPSIKIIFEQEDLLQISKEQKHK